LRPLPQVVQFSEVPIAYISKRKEQSTGAGVKTQTNRHSCYLRPRAVNAAVCHSAMGPRRSQLTQNLDILMFLVERLSRVISVKSQPTFRRKSPPSLGLKNKPSREPVSRRTIENKPLAQQWIYANHIENTSSSIVVFTARYIVKEVIRLLLAYSLLREFVY
jgi:hypothetical protein